jgi:subtilase family serine protease
VVSNSWETGEESQAPELTTIEHAILVRGAAEGVGMYFASGDSSGVEAPSSDPFAIAVGGTTLGIGATGDQPAYQRGVVPAALARPRRGDHSKGPVRSVPDLSADADPFTGLGTGLLSFPAGKAPVYSETDYGGTSLAAPLVAGMVAAAQQGQRRPFGFIDPVIYRLAGTSAFTDTLPLTSHSPAALRGVFCARPDCPFQALITSDDQSTSLLGYTGQVTLSGYDNMTGIGTPNGAAFINALRRLES